MGKNNFDRNKICRSCCITRKASFYICDIYIYKTNNGLWKSLTSILIKK